VVASEFLLFAHGETANAHRWCQCFVIAALSCPIKYVQTLLVRDEVKWRMDALSMERASSRKTDMTM